MASAPPPAKFMECCEVTWSDRANCGQRGARGVSPSWDALGREKKMLEAMGLPDSPKLTNIDVHKRYLKLAKRLHPDAGGTPDAAKFALVTGVCPRFAGRAARTGGGGVVPGGHLLTPPRVRANTRCVQRSPRATSSCGWCADDGEHIRAAEQHDDRPAITGGQCDGK